MDIIYQTLIRNSANLIAMVSMDFQRKQLQGFTPNQWWPTALIGERWVGKSYMILQYLKQSQKKSLYFSADDPILRGSSLSQIIQHFHFQYNYQLIAIDEIHMGEERADHLKVIIDTLPWLELIVLWSSSLDIYKWTAALQRRVYRHYMWTMNFAEYCAYKHKWLLPTISLDDLLFKSPLISQENCNPKLLNVFKEYIHHGYYPYGIFKPDIFHDLVRSNLQKVILEDLPTFLNMNTATVFKLEKLFYFIAHTPPSDFNYVSMSKKIWLSNDSLENVLYYLDQIGVINLVIRSNKLSDIVRKEFKVFLGNPSLYYAYMDNPPPGTLREACAIHHIKQARKKELFPDTIILPRYGDLAFEHDGNIVTIEVWWVNKTDAQVSSIPNRFIVHDNLEIWYDNHIPLWLFGLL